MSAHQVTEEHIRVLVDAAVRYRPLAGMPGESSAPIRVELDGVQTGTDAYAQQMGEILTRQNDISVSTLYGMRRGEPPYIHDAPRRRYSAAEVLVALHGYEYQACEDAGWPTSTAHELVRALERKMIRELPEYRAADTWSIPNAT